MFWETPLCPARTDSSLIPKCPRTNPACASAHLKGNITGYYLILDVILDIDSDSIGPRLQFRQRNCLGNRDYAIHGFLLPDVLGQS